MLGKSCISWEGNWCRGASTGGPCGTHVLMWSPLVMCLKFPHQSKPAHNQNARHVHFANTPVKPEVSNINLNVTPPRAQKEDTIAESILQNTMQTLASEFKHSIEPKIQKFRGGHIIWSPFSL